MANISFAAENTFHGPEGNFRAICKEIFEIPSRKKPGEKSLRLVFDPCLPPVDRKQIIYAITIPLKLTAGCREMAFLEGWLGKDAQRANGLNSDTLKGKWADLVIVHIHNNEHDYPYCNVSAALPPGTLVSEEQFRRQQGLPAGNPEQFELAYKPPELKKAA